jgi:hypothetical protein
VRSAEMMLDSGLAASGAAGDRTLDGSGRNVAWNGA